MPRGGKRQGKPGTPYQNRSDLTQAPSAAPGQTYGVQAQQLRAQQTAPLPKQAPPSLAPAAGPPGGPTPPGAQPTQAPMQPGGLGPLHAPTDNPNQPLTAGLPSGPGPGPEALAGQSASNPVDEIRAMYAAHPNDDLRRLLAYLDGG